MMRWFDQWNPQWTDSGSPKKDMGTTLMSIRYVRNAFEQRPSSLFPS
jgi:hypothetical protein